MTELADNYKRVIDLIAASAEKTGRSPEQIRLIAVSKTRSLEEVKSLLSLGQQAFAENTIQDAMTKIPALSSTPAQWHFIGHLQSKKAKFIPGYFQWVHSIDSMKLAEKLSRAMQQYSVTAVLNGLIQVNVSREVSKSGVLTDELAGFIEQLLQANLPGIHWRGLMTIGVNGDETRTRHAFIQLRQLQQKCRAEFNLKTFDQLSMGMSHDYRIAIEEGATMVRVGTAIFGLRGNLLT